MIHLSSTKRKYILRIFNHVWFLSHIRMLYWFIIFCPFFTVPGIYPSLYIWWCLFLTMYVLLHGLDQGSVNYSLHAKSGLLSLFCSFDRTQPSPLIYLFVSGCFCTTMAELNSCNRDHKWPTRHKIFTIWPLQKKACLPFIYSRLIQILLIPKSSVQSSSWVLRP